MIQYLTIDNITKDNPRFLIPANKILAVMPDGGYGIIIYYKGYDGETYLNLLFFPWSAGSDLSVAQVILPLYITKLLASDEPTMSVPLIAESSVWYIGV